MSTLLTVNNLSAALHGYEQRVLRSVSFSIDTGEVLGLVGESGAGKSMIGKAVLGILPKAARLKSPQPALYFQQKCCPGLPDPIVSGCTILPGGQK